MGLDSVELAMEIENYFDISIPDAEAETIYTIQQMVDTVARYRNVTSEEKTLQPALFQQIKTCLSETNLSLEDRIALFIGTGKQDYSTLSACLKITIPFPDFSTNEGTRFIDKIKRFISWTASYNAEELTFENLIDATLANNYRNVINPSAITNKYEIYIAVAGITADKIGVDFYEIAPGKSFTTDLGID